MARAQDEAVGTVAARWFAGSPAGFEGKREEMEIATIRGRLDFIRQAERLKDVLRSGRSSGGRQESTAEHSWRLCLMAMLFQDGLVGLDPLRVLQLCVVHDLGEALGGDVPAIVRDAHPDKSARERRDLLQLARSLDPAARERLLALWDEYEAAATPEARAVKALDKMETILQHSQGDNPPDFDYGFNLTYGRDYAQHDEVLRALRTLVDEATARRMAIPRADSSSA